MMEKCTDRAKRVIHYAKSEAKSELGSDEVVCAEHVLIGMAREHSGVAGYTLEEFGFTTSEIRKGLQRLYPWNKETSGHIVTLLLCRASDVAENYGDRFIGTEHLLVALMQIPCTVLMLLLFEKNIYPDEVIRMVETLIGKDVARLDQADYLQSFSYYA